MLRLSKLAICAYNNKCIDPKIYRARAFKITDSDFGENVFGL